jgi:mannose-6-phosphate isomerase-like protein (cupin superfamily)
MRIIVELARREIERFGSQGFVHSRLARGELQVSLAELDGVIGGHPATSRQLLVVLRGRVVVRTESERAELGERQAVEWDAGEWHETRTLEPSLVLLVEGELETFA